MSFKDSVILAVYGTLKKQLKFKPNVSLICKQAISTTPGYLIDYGDYPTFIPSTMIPGMYKALLERDLPKLEMFLKILSKYHPAYVIVEIYKIKSRAVMDWIDDFEGGMYVRRKFDFICLDNNKKISAYMYIPFLIELTPDNFRIVEPKFNGVIYTTKWEVEK